MFYLFRAILLGVGVIGVVYGILEDFMWQLFLGGFCLGSFSVLCE